MEVEENEENINVFEDKYIHFMSIVFLNRASDAYTDADTHLMAVAL